MLFKSKLINCPLSRFIASIDCLEAIAVYSDGEGKNHSLALPSQFVNIKAYEKKDDIFVDMKTKFYDGPISRFNHLDCQGFIAEISGNIPLMENEELITVFLKIKGTAPAAGLRSDSSLFVYCYDEDMIQKFLTTLYEFKKDSSGNYIVDAAGRYVPVVRNTRLSYSPLLKKNIGKFFTSKNCPFQAELADQLVSIITEDINNAFFKFDYSKTQDFHYYASTVMSQALSNYIVSQTGLVKVHHSFTIKYRLLDDKFREFVNPGDAITDDIIKKIFNSIPIEKRCSLCLTLNDVKEFADDKKSVFHNNEAVCISIVDCSDDDSNQSSFSTVSSNSLLLSNEQQTEDEAKEMKIEERLKNCIEDMFDHDELKVNIALDRLGVCGHFNLDKSRRFTNNETCERYGVSISIVKDVTSRLKEILGESLFKETTKNVAAYYEPSIRKYAN